MSAINKFSSVRPLTIARGSAESAPLASRNVAGGLQRASVRDGFVAYKAGQALGQALGQAIGQAVGQAFRQAMTNGQQQRRLENFSNALSTVSQHMGQLDGYRGRKVDGKVSMATLHQVANDNKASPELRQAAQTLIDDPKLLAELDVAGGGPKNRVFSQGNISAMQQTISARLDALDSDEVAQQPVDRNPPQVAEPVIHHCGTEVPSAGTAPAVQTPKPADTKQHDFDNALKTVADNFNVFDDVSKKTVPTFGGFGHGMGMFGRPAFGTKQVRDGLVSTSDLFKITEDQSKPKALRDAAQVLLDNPDKFKEMEMRLGGGQDQLFNLADAKAYLSDRKDSGTLDSIKADPAKAAELKENLQTLMNNFGKVDGANAFRNVKDGLFNKGDLNKLLNDNDPAVRKAAMYFLRNKNTDVFSAVDTGLHIGGKDGLVSMGDMQAIMSKLQ